MGVTMITNNDINDTIDTAETTPATATLPTVSASGNGNSNNSDSILTPRANNIFTCDICHKDYEYIGKHLCRYAKYPIKVCPGCDAKLPGSGSKHFRCTICVAIYRNGSPNSKFCPSCTLAKHTYNCCLCGNSFYRASRAFVAYPVCPDCYDNKLPGSGDFVLKCKSCLSFYRCGSGSSDLCPNCLALTRTVTCEYCHKDFVFPTTISFVDHYYCDTCKTNAEQVGKGNKYTLCKRCKKLIRGNTVARLCSACWTTYHTCDCDVCGATFVYQGRMDKPLVHVCPTCQSTLDTLYPDYKYTVKCHSCGSIVKANSFNQSLCPKCNAPTCPTEYTCSVCGKTFISATNNKYFSYSMCDDCRIESKKSKAVKEYESLIASGDWTECEFDGRALIIRPNVITDSIYHPVPCHRCGRLFTRNSSKHIYCRNCFYVNTCGACGHKYITTDKNNVYCSQGCGIIGNKLAKGIRKRYVIDPSKVANISTVDYTPLNIDVNVIDCNHKGGVWAVYDENSVLLDVHQTTNIAAEWKQIMKFTRSVFTYMRDDGVDLTKLTSKVVAFEDNFTKRLMIEEDFALKNNAKYWAPQPGTFQIDIITMVTTTDSTATTTTNSTSIKKEV